MQINYVSRKKQPPEATPNLVDRGYVHAHRPRLVLIYFHPFPHKDLQRPSSVEITSSQYLAGILQSSHFYSSRHSIAMSADGPITSFPAPGLPDQHRHIVGHNAEGKSVFLVSDKGDHGAIMVQGAAAQSIPYSTNSTPVDLEGDQDIKFAQENKVCSTLPLTDKIVEL